MDSEHFQNPEEAASIIAKARNELQNDPSYAAVIAGAAHRILARRTSSEHSFPHDKVGPSERTKD